MTSVQKKVIFTHNLLISYRFSNILPFVRKKAFPSFVPSKYTHTYALLLIKN